MKEIAEHAGVTNRCYPHKMRKTLGMELKNRGVDIGTIQEVLGHADSKVTSMYYAQSTPDTLRMIRKGQFNRKRIGACNGPQKKVRGKSSLPSL